MVITWFCPYCGFSLRNPLNIYSTIVFGKKVIKCAKCFNRVRWDGKRWVKDE